MKRIGQRYNEIAVRISEACDSRLLAMVFFVIYKAILDLIFLKFIIGYHSFFYLHYSIPNIANGWLITFIMAVFIVDIYHQNTASSVMLLILDLFYFIPMTTYCAYGGGASSFLFWGIVYWSILTILQFKAPVLVYETQSNSDIGYKSMLILTALAAAPILYVWVRYTHCRILTNLSIIYEIRAEAAQYTMPAALNYLLNIMPIVVAMLIVMALCKKKYILSITLLALMFVDFSIAGHKIILFFPLVLVGGFVFYRKEMICDIVPGAVVVELLAIAEQLLGKGLMISFVFRRMGIVLAQLSEYYYRFFLHNSIDFFRQGVLGKFGFDTIYSQTIPNVIGNNFETQVISCNNGLMADAWANLGFIGVLIMPVIVLFCMRLLDFTSYGIDMRLLIGLIIYYTFSFANSQWSTVLLTHGYIIMCILLLFFPRDSNKGIDNENNSI